ncbi:MAG: hypothetical protein M1818_002261 [Claussenomyces sp. TS43310]|nr:MAG: hypothetical protein M1818_002261 [Claussenomyces sp. TS43310]
MARSPGGRQQDFCIKQDGCLLERILASYSTYALCLLFDSGMSAYMTEVLTTAAHCHVPESISNAPLGLTLAQACLAINFSRTSFELHKGGAARTIPVEGKTPGLDGLSYQSNRRHFRHAGVARLDQAHQIAQHTCRSCPSLEQPTRLESVVEPDKNGVSIHGEHFHVGGTPVIEYRPSEKPCLVCGNLEWNRLPSDTSVRYGEERRLGMTSTVLERSALLDSCDTCRLLHIGIRNFAETLTAETYRKRLQDFDRDYMIWIKLRRDKCLRLLIYDAEGDSQRTVRGVGVFGGPLIIDLDFYGPSCTLTLALYLSKLKVMDTNVPI